MFRITLPMVVAVTVWAVGRSSALGAGAGGAIEVTSDPSGALITLQGEVRATGVTPFSAQELPPGLYRAVSEEPGYAGDGPSLLLPGGTTGAVHVQLQRKTGMAASMRSLLIPGWGQAYGERSTAATVYRSAFGVASVLVGFTGVQYLAERHRYEDAVEDYRQAGTSFSERESGEVGVARARVVRTYADMRDSRRHVGFAGAAMAGVWALSGLDALVFFPDLGGRLAANQTALNIAPEGSDGVRLEVTRAFR